MCLVNTIDGCMTPTQENNGHYMHKEEKRAHVFKGCMDLDLDLDLDSSRSPFTPQRFYKQMAAGSTLEQVLTEI